MARDPYDDEPDKPASSSGMGKLSVGKNVGPLPVWGWAAVAVAAVFLWRKIGGGAGAQQAAAATGMTAPAYPAGAGGSVYLLPGGSAPGAATPVPNGTGTTPAPAPTYLPVYPVGGSGSPPAGSSCPPGYVLLQGASGYTCATGAQSVQLGQYLAKVGA